MNMTWPTPAHASDTGVIEIIQEPPTEGPPEMPPPGGGCTPNIIISMEPATAEHASGGRQLEFRAPVCIMGDEAVRASLVRDAANNLTSTVGEVRTEVALSPELEARLEQAVQRVEIAASAQPPQAPPAQPAQPEGWMDGVTTLAAILVLAVIGAAVLWWSGRQREDGHG